MRTHRAAIHIASPSHLIYHPFCTTYHSPGSGTRWPITKDTTGDERHEYASPHLRSRTELTTQAPHSTPTPSLGRFYGNDLYIRRGRGVVGYGGRNGRKGRLSVLSAGAGRASATHCPPRCGGAGLSWREARRVDVFGDPVPAGHACMTDLASRCTHS